MRADPAWKVCAKAACALALGMLVGGCERMMQNMYDQPRYDPYAPSPLFSDGSSARALPEGAVPHAIGTLAGTSSGRIGSEILRERQRALDARHIPYPITERLLLRGRGRYDIYCAPCHSPVGDGDGLVARRGFPHPPSYHTEQLRNAPDRHFFDVITNGYGIMHSYADRVAPDDRWAVVAYIRALQFSQHAPLRDLPPDMQSAFRSADALPGSGSRHR